jgi:hypothetical protein
MCIDSACLGEKHQQIRAGAGVNDYGAKASRDLIVTRGAGFRKEKNKKKRGSYVGGEITVSHEVISKLGAQMVDIGMQSITDANAQHQV